ncbi:putative serine/threonine-protein kinase YPL150W [Ceratocystis fimbriata CBS 114723]|nr:putative serine/threonine-protein kinase YPL150W [Ceratocystis fimbriata CBS 114723]
MQSLKAKANDPSGRKAKLAQSYQQLLDEFSTAELRSVGNYTLGRLIGKGSFGKVYLATHKLTNGSKVVLKSANKNDSNLAREIHHHRQFIHPHIARLYEIIVTETMVWMVLEYCAGDELYNHLLKHGPLPVEKVKKIFAQLVGAVSYVHQHSCVHRDLKLENILFDKNENVKLVDFGFTREYEGKTNHLQTFCGTICYSAPEMLKGEKYAGEKVDVWSLGVILYALLCGELPFDDDIDNETRRKILSEEPKYPDHIPSESIPLIKSLLSKRPLLRPSLPEILSHPFLAEHAPGQQAILNVQQTSPFTTQVEKDTLERLRYAGVNIDNVIESVLAERCDALGGWWALLLEKEQRKLIRRERKRKEKEAETRSMRRLSAASSRFERMTLPNVDEKIKSPAGRRRPSDHLIATPRTRGRSERRGSNYSSYFDYPTSDLPQLQERLQETSLHPNSPRPLDRESVRSSSTSRTRRPIPPPKEGDIRSARSRGSTLHLVAPPNVVLPESVPEVENENGPEHKVRKKHSQAFITQWKNWTHWIFETTRRTRPGRRTSNSVTNLREKVKAAHKESKDHSPRPQSSKYPRGKSQDSRSTSTLPPGFTANGQAASKPIVPLPPNPNTYQQPPPLSPVVATPNNRITPHYKRQSLSPSPLTPRSTMRRSSVGLRGRKSTSSSVSSIRSIHHHHHTHSKASSTSSNGSISTTLSKATLGRGTSPHHSVKMLPAAPATQAIPSSIRLVRGSGPPPLAMYNEGMPTRDMQVPGSPNPFGSGGGGVMFAKRKRNVFKGPMLSIATAGAPGARANTGSKLHGHSHSRSASASGLGRRSGEITIAEEDELEEEDIEDVEEFSPVVSRPGEIVEEHIFEDIEAEESLSMDKSALSIVSDGPTLSSSGAPTLPPLDMMPKLTEG